MGAAAAAEVSGNSPLEVVASIPLPGTAVPAPVIFLGSNIRDRRRGISAEFPGLLS